MKIAFRGGKTNHSLLVDTTAKTYQFFTGYASGSYNLDSVKELDRLAVDLFKLGFSEVK